MKLNVFYHLITTIELLQFLNHYNMNLHTKFEIRRFNKHDLINLKATITHLDQPCPWSICTALEYIIIFLSCYQRYTAEIL